MNTESFVGSLQKQKEVQQEEQQQILLFTELTWQNNMDKNLFKEIQELIG